MTSSQQPPRDLADLVRRLDAEAAEAQAAEAAATAQLDGAVAETATGATRHSSARRRRILTISITAALALVLGGGVAAWAVIANQDEGAPEATTAAPASTPAPAPSTAEPTEEPEQTPAPEPEPDPEPVAEPPVAAATGLDDPSSYTVVVNKQRALNPVTFTPSDLAYPEIPNSGGQPLRYQAAVALEQMHAEASAAGLPFAMVSGYRSYDLQTQLFNNYAAGYGVAAAETFSARPGHSEHQTGLAVDISECLGCPLSEAFGSTAQGLWARANAHRFGFILRYDQGQQPVVGYVYEPWHFRYVGVDVATDMHNRGIVNFEEYTGLPAAPSY